MDKENFYEDLMTFADYLKDDSVTVNDLIERSKTNVFVLPVALSIGQLYQRKYRGLSKEIFFLVNALCHELNRNDICLHVNEESICSLLLALCSDHMDEDEFFLCQDNIQECAKDICRLILNSSICQDNIIIDDGSGASPLVFNHDHLYFRSFYNYETDVSAFIKNACEKNSAISDEDCEHYKKALSILFKDESDGSLNYQRIAASQAISSNLSVITGGPGTGKTTTVLSLLVLLLLKNPDLKIRLAAPTGKAAARMSESISSGLNNPYFKESCQELCKKGLASAEEIQSIEKLIPNEAITVHKLLGIFPHREIPKFNQDNPLPYDVLIIDEVSMIALGMFSKLLKAIDKNTRVILLGDKDQLCSVEPGSVLSDICSGLDEDNSSRLSAQRCSVISSLSSYDEKTLYEQKLTDYVAMLIKSRRFSSSSALGKFARAVNDASDTDDRKEQIMSTLKVNEGIESFFAGDAVIELFNISQSANYKSLKAAGQESARQVFNLYTQKGEFLDKLKQQQGIVTRESCAEFFTLLDRYRILCSNRNGALGTDILNAALQNMIYSYMSKANIKSYGEFFAGRVILITKNNDVLGVNNGDVGFTAFYKDDAGKVALKVIFPGKDRNSPRIISTEQLADYDDGMAMTIHKSQGSEYENVIMVLSNRINPVMCKELVYTGITRAKELTDKSGKVRGGRVAIIANRDLLLEIVKRKVKRQSGLALRLRR